MVLREGIVVRGDGVNNDDGDGVMVSFRCQLDTNLVRGNLN